MKISAIVIFLFLISQSFVFNRGSGNSCWLLPSSKDSYEDKWLLILDEAHDFYDMKCLNDDDDDGDDNRGGDVVDVGVDDDDDEIDEIYGKEVDVEDNIDNSKDQETEDTGGFYLMDMINHIYI